MRMPPLIKDFLAWRWAPCVALTTGSLAFVGLAVLLIPGQIDAARSTDTSNAFDQPPRSAHAMYNASLAQGVALAQNTVSPGPTENAPQPQPARFRPQPPPLSTPAARGFSPVLEKLVVDVRGLDEYRIRASNFAQKVCKLAQ